MRLNRECLQGWEEGSDFISLVFCFVLFFWFAGSSLLHEGFLYLWQAGAAL